METWGDLKIGFGSAIRREKGSEWTSDIEKRDRNHQAYKYTYLCRHIYFALLVLVLSCRNHMPCRNLTRNCGIH